MTEDVPNAPYEVGRGIGEVVAGGVKAAIVELNPANWEPSGWAGKLGDHIVETLGKSARDPLSLVVPITPSTFVDSAWKHMKAYARGKETGIEALVGHVDDVNTKFIDGPIGAQVKFLKPLAEELAMSLAGPRKTRSAGRTIGLVVLIAATMVVGKVVQGPVTRILGRALAVGVADEAENAAASAAVDRAASATSSGAADGASSRVVPDVAPAPRSAPSVPAAPVEPVIPEPGPTTGRPGGAGFGGEAPAVPRDGLAQKICPDAPRGEGVPSGTAGSPAAADGTSSVVAESTPTEKPGTRELGALGEDSPASAAPVARPRVDKPVRGLYESIDPDRSPAGWKFEHEVTNEADGRIKITTKISGPGMNPNQGRVSPHLMRVFDPKTSTLEMKQAFLKDLPGWVEGEPIAMVPGKGTPTQALGSMMQMKKLGIPYGGLRHVQMSGIQNVETLIQLQQQLDRGVPINEAVLKTASVGYAETTLTQSGHRIVASTAEVVLKAKVEPIGETLDHQIRLGLLSEERGEEILSKYGVDRSYKVNQSYDIHFDVEAIEGGK